MKKVYNKLVRDKILEIIMKSGNKPNYKIITDKKELLKLLADKIIEEANEFKNAIDGNGDYLEELLDVLCVLDEMQNLCITEENINEVLDMEYQKNNDKGTFKNHIYLESVEGQNDVD